MNKFQLTPRERAAFKALYLSSLTLDGQQAIDSGRYYDLERRWPQLADINLSEKHYFQRAVDEIGKWKAPKKIAQCQEDARRALSKLDGMISMMHGRVLQEEFEDSYFKINTPLDFGYPSSAISADFSYSWKHNDQWKYGRIKFTRHPLTPKPKGNDQRSRSRSQTWSAENRGWLIQDGYYKLRDYLAEMETGEGLPSECNVSEAGTLLPKGRSYNLNKYLLVKEEGNKTRKETPGASIRRHGKNVVAENNEPSRDAARFHLGEKVRHHIFGEGRVVSTDRNKVEVEFDAPYNRKRLLDTFLILVP